MHLEPAVRLRRLRKVTKSQRGYSLYSVESKTMFGDSNYSRMKSVRAVEAQSGTALGVAPKGLSSLLVRLG
jgi:hypothetical protein